jgi:hypothetical protein
MTNSAEQELEATIWAAMAAHKVTTVEPLEFIETIMAAAKDYAAGDSDALTETRRLVLHEATRPDRIDRPVAAEGGTGPRARPFGLERPALKVPEGATLSTGCVVPSASQGSAKFRPQAVDKPTLADALRDSLREGRHAH